MKIQTSDGQVFDVPENNVESFLAEYETTKKTFTEANEQLADVDRQLHPGGRYGFWRNVLAGLGAGPRVEGAIRSIPSGFQDYTKYRDWARKSATDYAMAYPERALGGGNWRKPYSFCHNSGRSHTCKWWNRRRCRCGRRRCKYSTRSQRGKKCCESKKTI